MRYIVIRKIMLLYKVCKKDKAELQQQHP